MFAKLFRKQTAQPTEPFVDKVLGEFTFDPDLGWKKPVVLGGQHVTFYGFEPHGFAYDD